MNYFTFLYYYNFIEIQFPSDFEDQYHGTYICKQKCASKNAFLFSENEIKSLRRSEAIYSDIDGELILFPNSKLIHLDNNSKNWADGDITIDAIYDFNREKVLYKLFR